MMLALIDCQIRAMSRIDSLEKLSQMGIAYSVPSVVPIEGNVSHYFMKKFFWRGALSRRAVEDAMKATSLFERYIQRIDELLGTRLRNTEFFGFMPLTPEVDRCIRQIRFGELVIPDEVIHFLNCAGLFRLFHCPHLNYEGFSALSFLYVTHLYGDYYFSTVSAMEVDCNTVEQALSSSIAGSFINYSINPFKIPAYKFPASVGDFGIKSVPLTSFLESKLGPDNVLLSLRMPSFALSKVYSYLFGHAERLFSLSSLVAASQHSFDKISASCCEVYENESRLGVAEHLELVVPIRKCLRILNPSQNTLHVDGHSDGFHSLLLALDTPRWFRTRLGAMLGIYSNNSSLRVSVRSIYAAASLEGKITDEEEEDVKQSLRLPDAPSVSVAAPPFIPQYYPGMPKATMFDIASSLPVSVDSQTLLLSRGYPPHFVKSFLVEKSTKGVNRLKELRQAAYRRGQNVAYVEPLEVVPSAAGRTFVGPLAQAHSEPAYKKREPKFVKASRLVPLPFERAKSGGHWRIKTFPCVIAPKPSLSWLSQASFRRWVSGIAWTLSKQLNRKTQYITGNESARLLFFLDTTRVRQQDLAKHLEESSIFIDDYTFSRVGNPSTVTLDQYVMKATPAKATRYLSIGNRVVSTPEQLESMVDLFKRHKPFFRKALAYLSYSEEQDFDPILFQTELSKKFASVYMAASFEGNTAPAIRHTLDVSIDTTSIPAAVQNLATAVGSPGLNSYARVAVQVVSFIGALVSASTPQAMLAVILQFLSGNDKLWKYFSERVCGWQTSTSKLEGLGDDIANTLKEWWSVVWETVVTSSVIVMLQEIYREAFEVFIGPLRDLVASIRFSLLKEMGQSIARSLLSAITECLSRVKACIDQRSFLPLWGPRWDPALWVQHSLGMINNFVTLTAVGDAAPLAEKEIESLRVSNTIPSYITHSLTFEQYVSTAQTHIEDGVRIRDYFARSPILVRDLSHTIDMFRAFLSDILGFVQGAGMRVAPFFIYWYGPTSVGKTNMARKTATAVGKMRKYDIEKGIHEWLMNTNFQEGFDHTKWAVMMDDIDQSVAPPAAGVKNHIEHVLELVNNKPYAVEQADVRLKGKVRANPLLLNYMSNYRDARVRQNSLYPLAFWRRINLYVEVEVKPEFRKVGSFVLDPEKALDSDTHDMYLLKVSRFRTPGSGDSLDASCLTPPEVYTFPDFVALVQREFSAHLVRQKELVARAVMYNGDLCEICGLDANYSCNHSDRFIPKDAKLEGLISSLKEKLLALYDAFRSRFYIGGTLTVKSSSFSKQLWLWNFQSLQDRVYRAFRREAVMVATASAVGGLAAAGLALAIMRYLSKEYLEGRDINSNPGLVPLGWLRADQKFTPGVPMVTLNATFTKDDVLRALSETRCLVRGPKYTCFGYLVGQNMILTTTHAIEFGQSASIIFPERTLEMVVTEFNCATLTCTPDLCLIKNGEFKGTRSIINYVMGSLDDSIAQFDEGELHTDGVLKMQTCLVKRSGSQKILEYKAPTKEGMCGGLCLVRHNNYWWIVGAHNKGYEVNGLLGKEKYGYAPMFGRDDLRNTAQRLAGTLEGVVTSPFLLTKKPEAIGLSHFPYKSEVWAAMSFFPDQCHLWPKGQLEPKLSGSTMKTKIKFSVFSEHFRDLEEKWCGKKHYWLLPNFRGRMVEDKWYSPWTDALLYQSVTPMDDQLMWTALADYLSGIDELDNSGYGVLSEHNAISGVPSANIHRINLKTSMGPPFTENKKGHFIPGDAESWMSPAAAAIYDSIHDLWDEGYVVSLVGIMTLKDEALKEGKLPRVFTNLNACGNIAQKQMFKAMTSFVRANWKFFESLVGINMTSSECNKVVEHLLSMGPADLIQIWDGDAKRMDKSWSGQKWDFVSLTIYAINFVILGTKLAMKCYRVALGLKHTVYSIKNDLFSIFVNPSGNDTTVELNGFLISLCERFVYYRRNRSSFDALAYMRRFFDNPIPTPDERKQLTFRAHMKLATYGDDNLKSTLIPLPDDYCQIWKDEVGIEMTDASKSTSMRAKSLSEVEFLKRKFVWDAEFKMYLAQLSLKSMCRTLLIKKESSLSDLDHAATALTEVLREAVYYGESFYNYLRYRFTFAAQEFGLKDNPYLCLPRYSFYRDRMRVGNFSAWEPREKLEHREVSLPRDVEFFY